MGSCFGKSQHQLLKEEQDRTDKLQRSLLVLSELAHTHEMRKLQIDAEIQQNKLAIEELLGDYAKGVHERDYVKGRLISLQMKNRFLENNFKKANEHLINARQQEDVVREFSQSIQTSQKMTTVVHDLSSIGFKVESLEKMSDQVTDMFDKMRDVNITHTEAAATDNALDYRDLDADAESFVSEQLDKIDELDRLQLDRELATVTFPSERKQQQGSSSATQTATDHAHASRSLLSQRKRLFASDTPTHTLPGGLRSDADTMDEEEEEDPYQDLN